MKINEKCPCKKNVNVMENATNAGNIMLSLNVRDLFIVKKENTRDLSHEVNWPHIC